MKQPIYNLIMAIIEIIAFFVKAGRRMYRRFCIKVLWKHFLIKTPVYYQWHDRRVAKIQKELDILHSSYPSF